MKNSWRHWRFNDNNCLLFVLKLDQIRISDENHRLTNHRLPFFCVQNFSEAFLLSGASLVTSRDDSGAPRLSIIKYNMHTNQQCTYPTFQSTNVHIQNSTYIYIYIYVFICHILPHCPYTFPQDGRPRFGINRVAFARTWRKKNHKMCIYFAF